MKERQYLKKKTILLCGESEGTVFKRKFTIRKRLSEGASAICYEADYENSSKGVLKEFYPQDTEALERDPSGQVIRSKECTDRDVRRLAETEELYIKPYELLLEQKRKNDDLATFIPVFEIYYGCNEAGEKIGTTYIWTPEPKVWTFDKMCEEIHKHPTKDPEHKLVTVLTAIESLTKCICVLHSAGMIHRDIKPSNFGFINRGNEVLTQTLSLFDINTICTIDSKNTEIAVGTKEYLESEAGYKAANNQTDIYAIGATLFHAIIVSDETKESGYHYHAGFYSKLGELVDTSKLIQASEANAHPRLKRLLTKILRNCLCKRGKRYANCEELLEDIKSALFYALPSNIARKSFAGKKWALMDLENALDANKDKDSYMTMQCHLYEHPLYRYSSNENLDVCVIGFGNYGQKFLDVCLQNGQMIDKTLRVTVLSADLQDKEDYLDERPELADFFNIDGSLTGKDSEDSYGDIVFEEIKLGQKKEEANADILRTINQKYYGSKMPHYIFIALGEDALNESVAKTCESLGKASETDCIISYAYEGEPATKRKKGSKLFPLYVNKNVKETAIYPEIERMAFNTHLVWEKNLNVDYKLVREEYRKTYNHNSSVSYAVSIKYKLYSIGIDLDGVSFAEAASKFSEVMKGKQQQLLMWLEHRRWVTEKLCLGWKKREIKDCLNGVTKDEKKKEHVCIVKGKPENVLKTWAKGHWDTKSVSGLDEYDKMSVMLHRGLSKKAKDAKEQLSDKNLSNIRMLVEGNRKAFVAFQEWSSCLKDIWHEDSGKVHLYKSLKLAFQNATDELSEQQRASVRSEIRAFEALFSPVLASAEYRNWKMDDSMLVENIPFILTYTEKAELIIPFAVGNSNDLFGNVAAATVVNPARIIYLYFIEKGSDSAKLETALPFVVSYMKNKKIKSAVEFVLVYNEKAVDSIAAVEQKVKALGGGRIQAIKSIILDENTVSADLEKYLKQRCKKAPFFAAEKNGTPISQKLEDTLFYASFEWYRFNSKRIIFERTTEQAAILRYIKKQPHITVSDVITLNSTSNEKWKQPEFYTDYKELWKKYNESTKVWKNMCNFLYKYSGKNKLLGKFGTTGSGQGGQYSYIVPISCKKSCSDIIKYLKAQGLISANSCIETYTTESCKVTINDCYNAKKQYDKLFSMVYALMVPEAISIYTDSRDEKVKVIFDSLVVEDYQVTATEYEASEVVDRESGETTSIGQLLEYFYGKGYLLNFNAVKNTNTNEYTVSFTYATRQIKQLLMMAGNILEVYTYHTIKDRGLFDDVVSSYEINWGDTSQNNEFDFIVTKGFRSLIIECKAKGSIEREDYVKLNGLLTNFGINTTAVLITDTDENPNRPDSNNAENRLYGEMKDIITIWKKVEIGNIGSTLASIMKDK